MLYVAMTGAQQNTLAQRAHANNLANVNTSGFRRDYEQARAMQVFGPGFPSRVMSMSERPATDLQPGSLQETGRDLDVAVSGKGWIAVQAPDGKEAYVRTGSLIIDSVGMLRTGDGLPVMGNAGPIALPPEQQVEVGLDGTISIRGAGEAPSVVSEVERIKLVQPEDDQLEKGTDGLMRLKDGGEAPVDGAVRMVSGFLESSNVNAVEEMTSIMSLSRQFELNVKMMSTAEDNARSMERVLQIS
nr:flagellar basal body rod protein FlgF [Atopomonas sediminilitoris]